MNTDILYRRLDTIEWMLTLPPGENDSKIEMAIKTCKDNGSGTKEIIQFINIAFRAEIDEFISWLDEINSKAVR
jgi:hypothetical protein